jgi:hypothetical protein
LTRVKKIRDFSQQYTVLIVQYGGPRRTRTFDQWIMSPVL